MEDQEWVETTRDQIARLNCYLDQESMERLLGLYLLEDDHQQRLSIKSDIEVILGSYAPHLFFSKKPVLPSPTLEESSGEVTLGTVMQGDRNLHPFGMSLSDLKKHSAIFASTGSGTGFGKNHNPLKDHVDHQHPSTTLESPKSNSMALHRL